jgi:hydroxyethylthiazole kinase
VKLTQEFEEIFQKIKSNKPLIHHITSYVTANDSANAVLALGGSPVMADEEQEVEEMVSLASALVLNIGTLNHQKMKSFLRAGKKANALGIPVVLDPVGLGSTRLRQDFVADFLTKVHPSVIRGNMSEMVSLSGSPALMKGVDSTLSSEEGGDEIAKTLAERLQCTIAITGKVDVVSNGSVTYHIDNGHPHLSKITGTGCVSSSFIGLCCASGGPPIYSALLGLSIMGISGEIAESRLDPQKGQGLGSFKVHLFDAFSRFSLKDYQERGKIYEIQSSRQL